MHVKPLLAILLFTILVPSFATVTLYSDDIQFLFNQWLSGEPKIMVELDIAIPRVDAGQCYVVVLRLPSLYRPTRTGLSEEVYAGIHPPGTRVRVKQVLPALIAKTRFENGEYKVEYYEPVEYFVGVLCERVSDSDNVFSAGVVQEVFPRGLITRQLIDFDKQGAQPTDHRAEDAVDGFNSSFQCNFVYNQVTGSYECYTWVRGPLLYSINGLETRFGITGTGGGLRPTAIYIESFYNYHLDFTNGSWSSSGRKLAHSVVSKETSPLSGNWRDRLYFYTKFIYERRQLWCSPLGFCRILELIYPVAVLDVQRSENSNILPPEKTPYNPPSSTPYCAVYTYGEQVVGFTENCRESNEVNAVVSISFTLGNYFTVSLAVDFYKAGRNDNSYSTPYVKIRDLTNRTSSWYYWWYRDCDSMSYEVQFKSS